MLLFAFSSLSSLNLEFRMVATQPVGGDRFIPLNTVGGILVVRHRSAPRPPKDAGIVVLECH